MQKKEGMPNCKICRKTDALPCSGCDSVHYCSTACQTADWKAHKAKCAESATIGPVFRRGKWEELPAVPYGRVTFVAEKILKDPERYPPIAEYYALWARKSTKKDWDRRFSKKIVLARKKHLNPTVGWEEWLDLLLFDFAETVPGLAYPENADDDQKLAYLRDVVVPYYLSSVV